MNSYTHAEQLATIPIVIRSGYIRAHRLAIDAGANRGAWTVQMADRFERVLAFEPGDLAYGVLKDATAHLMNVRIERAALFSRTTMVTVRQPKNTTSSRGKFVVPDPIGGDVVAVAIDTLNLPFCDFIKIDVEGSEHDVLDGAEFTIKTYRPVICIEMKARGLRRFGHNVKELRRWLRDREYKFAFNRWCDEVYVPKEF